MACRVVDYRDTLFVQLEFDFLSELDGAFQPGDTLRSFGLVASERISHVIEQSRNYETNDCKDSAFHVAVPLRGLFGW
jgi:hypothetical protein